MKRKTPPWWNYVKCIIREYPKLKKEIDKPVYPYYHTGKAIKTAVNKSEYQNSVEQSVLNKLSSKSYIKYDAINKAIKMIRIKHPKDYENRLKLIDLVYWKDYTIEGASMQVPCHPNTGSHWQGEFVKLVANELDLP